MKLFSIDENNEVVINFPWIRLVPEFNALFTYKEANKRRFTKDTLAKKLMGYIYFMLDFNSPIMDWEEDAKKKEALRYTNLEPTDIDAKVKEAMALYEKLQYEACRPLKTYRSVLKSLDAMDTYFETVNFDDKDKMGKLLYTPNQLTANIAVINKAYSELAKLEASIEEALGSTKTVRGKAQLSTRELNGVKGSTKTWDEGSNPDGDKTKWKELGAQLNLDNEEEEYADD